jgi:hypothetical protein
MTVPLSLIADAVRMRLSAAASIEGPGQRVKGGRYADQTLIMLLNLDISQLGDSRDNAPDNKVFTGRCPL